MSDSTIDNAQLTTSENSPQFLLRAIDWLAYAQYENGGWGADQHLGNQLHNASIDPATTAFSAMALMRAGNTLQSGKYSKQVRLALDQLLSLIEGSQNNKYNITNERDTQPQRKLGQNIDVAMASQFLTKIRTGIQDKQLADRVDKAIEECIVKIEQAQNANGSSQDGGWAPVLQSAMAVNALELAEVRGYKVDGVKIANAKRYQKAHATMSGSAAPADAAGIPLYALASAQRATAGDASVVESTVAQNVLMDAEQSPNDLNEVVVRELIKKGKGKEEAEQLAESYIASRAATKRLEDDAVWRGFGNNGGEEFLSYMMTSESMVQQGQNAWIRWYEKIARNFESIQNGDGSWSGHHCITSPVFCTAAVILSLTAGEDPDLIAVANGR